MVKPTDYVVLICSIAGEYDYRYIGNIANTGTDLPTIHLGHDHIQKNQIGPMVKQKSQALLTTISREYLIALISEYLFYHSEEADIVVNHKYLLLHFAPL
jgi:hypothetical protein